MLPDRFTDRIKKQEYIDADKLLSALKEPSPVSIRINPLKWNRIPLNSEPVPWCSTGFYLEERPSFTFDPLFHAGCYYPQEASGMFLEQLFSQGIISGKKIRILDLCAAPGGKTTHIASLAPTEALIVANDPIRLRAGLLADNMTKWGIPNTIVTQSDPAQFGRLENFFDVILIDAPCSGEGMFRDRTATEEWSEETAAHCSLRQKRILMDCWPALKRDGILIYCTCTFNPCENEENIRWLLKRHEVEILEMDISCFNGITAIDREGIAGYGFHPGKIRGEGFFISVMRKNENREAILTRNRSQKIIKASPDDLKIVGEWTFFDRESVMKSGNDLFSLHGNPDDYNLLSGFVRIIKSGTRICSVKNRSYRPSHELALSTCFNREAFPNVGLDLDQAISFLKREEIKTANAPSGWFVPTYTSVNLGFANNIGHRINNYFPVGWRIRMNLAGNKRYKITGWN